MWNICPLKAVLSIWVFSDRHWWIRMTQFAWLCPLFLEGELFLEVPSIRSHTVHSEVKGNRAERRRCPPQRCGRDIMCEHATARLFASVSPNPQTGVIAVGYKNQVWTCRLCCLGAVSVMSQQESIYLPSVAPLSISKDLDP